MITVTSTNKLTVKELTTQLGVSVSYLYKARMAGLPMEWDKESHCYVQTTEKVKKWIKRKKFCVVNGSPRV